MNKRLVLIAGIVLIFAILLISSLSGIVNFYTDWLWFGGLGLEAMFLKVLTAKLSSAGMLGLVFFVFMAANFFLSRRPAPVTEYFSENELLKNFKLDFSSIYTRYVNLALYAIVFMTIFIALGAAYNWEIFLRYANATPFAAADPVFNKDISFYVFKLPALKYLYGWSMFVLVLALLQTVVIYIFNRGARIFSGQVQFSGHARAHLSVLAALFLLLKSAGYRLETYGLLFSRGDLIFGATYTDLHARLPVLYALTAISLACALLFLANIFMRNWKIPAGGLALLVIVSFFGFSLYPGLVQKFKVTPNEIVTENPYIKRNIEYTRKAYNLDSVELKELSGSGEISLAQLQKKNSALDNIRVWDHRPLLTTYQQLQGIRTYYRFTDVDIDRYMINGRYRQVMLSARELAYDSLPSRIWINEHLSFTHGYGVCLSPVNTFTGEGMPELFVKDIPPVGLPDLKITRPEIYFGEIPNEYVIVKTRSREFDYPSGDENIYSTYEGNGGIRMSSILRRVAFALKFSSIKIILNTDINRDSRIMYYRGVKERLNKICPFIAFDRDPYIVVSAGRLYWLCDGYTVSSSYPYSQPVSGDINYIRNSVKAVVDAYDGSVNLYVSDRDDPVIRTYCGMFPGVFKPLEEMSADLKAHLRYPEEMFKMQTAIYSIYHMDEPQNFYNKEDVWNIPNEVFEQGEQPIEPYYIILKLPGEDREEFMLMQPLTPMSKSNLAAWFCVRCDYPGYGKLTAFRFPKKELVYGPMQIEARIDQDPVISQQLSLWGQRGSQVIRGNLLVIPIENSLIYIEPLYLKAERGQLPELKRIIVAYKNHIAMEEDLPTALKKALTGAETTVDNVENIPSRQQSVSELASEALKHFNKAGDFTRKNDWSGFGEELKKVGDLLEKLKQTAGK